MFFGLIDVVVKGGWVVEMFFRNKNAAVKVFDVVGKTRLFDHGDLHLLGRLGRHGFCVAGGFVNGRFVLLLEALLSCRHGAPEQAWVYFCI